MTMTAETAPDAGADVLEAGETPRARRKALRRIKAAGVVFALTTACLTVAAYQFGEGQVWIGDRTISDMNVFEVTGASAAGAAGLFAGLGAAVIALIAALAATVLSLGLAVFVGGLGVFFALGVVTGPVLLAVVCGVLVKRRYYPDVI